MHKHALTRSELQISAEGGWVALNRWPDQIGISSTTAYRWRKRGWLSTTVIAGKHYLSPANLQEFERRAAMGEFVRVPHGTSVCKSEA